MEPFAFVVYRRFLEGATLADLAREFGIPEERLEPRIRAAEGCWKLRRKTPAEAPTLRRAAGAGDD